MQLREIKLIAVSNYTTHPLAAPASPFGKEAQNSAHATYFTARIAHWANSRLCIPVLAEKGQLQVCAKFGSIKRNQKSF